MPSWPPCTGANWLDNKDCIVLDYSETSLVARWIRDEIRMIGAGFYVGRVYWEKTPLIHFSRWSFRRSERGDESAECRRPRHVEGS